MAFMAKIAEFCDFGYGDYCYSRSCALAYRPRFPISDDSYLYLVILCEK